MFNSVIAFIDWISALVITVIMLIVYIICGGDNPRGQQRDNIPADKFGKGVDSADGTSVVSTDKVGRSAGIVGAGIVGAGMYSTSVVSTDKVSTDKVSTDIDKTYKILSFNVEYEATNYSPDEVMQIIDSLGADIIVLNEAHEAEGHTSNSEYSSKIADALAREGINHAYSHDWAIIASRRKITQPHKGSENKYIDSAALIDDKLYVISAHLTDYPYQPFQLAHIPYCYDTCQKNICSKPWTGITDGKSNTDVAKGVAKGMSTTAKGSRCTKSSAESQMIEQATLARGTDVDLILSAIEYLNDHPVILAGDFNEPSHLDWTDAAVRAGDQPLSVRFPTSSRIAAAGMQDLYRMVHPDPVKNPGHTWPARPLTKEYLADLSQGKITEQIATPTDRIDFIYGKGVEAVSAEVIVTPSDHNAVVVNVQCSHFVT